MSRRIGILLILSGELLSIVGWYLLRGLTDFKGGLGAIGLFLLLALIGGAIYLFSSILILVGSISIRGDGALAKILGSILLATPVIYTLLMPLEPVEWFMVLPLLGAIHIPSGLMLLTGRRLGFLLGILLLLGLAYLGYGGIFTV